MGMVNRVAPAGDLERAAKEMARSIADEPAKPIGLMKKLLNQSSCLDLPTLLDLEAQAQMICSQTEDHRKRVQAFLRERRRNEPALPTLRDQTAWRFPVSLRKIDIYAHIVPRRFWDALKERVGATRLIDVAGGELRSIEATRSLYDLDQRFRIMDKYPDMAHVLVPTTPPLDLVCTSEQKAIDLAQIFNDEAADLVSKHPDRFVGAVALLPLGNMDTALEEAERVMKESNFVGILLTSPRYGQDIKVTKPLDMADMLPLYEMMAQVDLPIWIHPRREYSVPDYTVEERSEYCLHQCFGWPYETTLAMARLVYSGILARIPTLKFITHHAGAMVPFMGSRIEGSCDWYEMSLGVKFTKRHPKRPVEYFRMFYNDTAIYGNTPGLMCACSFFGADRMLFGTDFPYDAQWGDTYTRKTIEAIEAMDIPGEDKEKIFIGNARKILKLKNA